MANSLEDSTQPTLVADSANTLTSNDRHAYDHLVDSLPVCIARFDHEYRLLFMNMQLEVVLNQRCKTVLHQPLSALKRTNDEHTNTRLEQTIKQVFTEGKSKTIEAAWQTAHGERYYEIKYVPEFNVHGDVQTVLEIAHDITEHKAIENEHHQHLSFMHHLDTINRILQEEADIEKMMAKVLDTLLTIFDCDRAYMLYPCDPNATEWHVPIERTTPEFPGAGAISTPLPMNTIMSNKMRWLLNTNKAIQLTANTPKKLDAFFTEQFQIQSLMGMALHPKTGKAWEFGIQRCAQKNTWDDYQQNLFEEIGHRLSDGLNSLLITRNLKDSEERFRLVYENSPVPIWEEDFSVVKKQLDQLHLEHGKDLESHLTANPDIVQTLAESVRILNINQAVLKLHDAESKTDLIEGIHQTFTEASYQDFRTELVAIARGKTHIAFDSMVKTLKGDTKAIHLSLQICPGYEDTLSRVLVSTTDITERKRSEASIQLAATVFSASQEGIFISDAYNRIVDVNASFTRLTGYSREEAIGKNPSFLSSRQHDKAFYETLWQTIQTDGHWQGEIWNQRKSGEIYPEQLSIVAIKDDQQKLQHYVAAFSDISAIKQHEAELNRIANYDMLTALPNRRLLQSRLESAIENAKKNNASLAVCYLDLDNFKRINDLYEHDGGDKLLVEFSNRMKTLLHPDDTIARLGGDEFVLLLNNIKDRLMCTQLLDQILEKVAEPILISETLISVSASIGVTFFPDDQADADNLLRHADHAMYNAKQLGKNRYQFFDIELEQAINSRSKLVGKVAQALHNNQLRLYYQPKINVASGEVAGAEALLRWHDPELDIIQPDTFLPAIEYDTIALDIGRWVLKEGIRQAKSWHDAGINITISLNAFSKHIKSPVFIEDVRQAIHLFWPDMPKGSILLEIVETAELENLEHTEKVIAQCVEMGIGFSLDDFGTGYSSLTYLQRLSIEELKIDQSFIRDMLEDPNDEAIAVSIIGLGNVFNLRVVAEGAETEAHAQRLLTLGCEVVQGYAYSQALPANDFEAWINAHSSKKQL